MDADDPSPRPVLGDTQGPSITFPLEGTGEFPDPGLLTLVGDGESTRIGVKIANPSRRPQAVHIRAGRCGAIAPESLYEIPPRLKEPGGVGPHCSP